MILFNALGIQDSGGITVLKKCLHEINDVKLEAIIIHNPNPLIDDLITQFTNQPNFHFIAFVKKNFLQRLWIENWKFHAMIQKYKINIIYNFSGTGQFFLGVPQLIKLQNLMFYSHQLDKTYFGKRKYFSWLRQIGLKRLVFLSMYRNQKYFEIQSEHVQTHVCKFISPKNKIFFLKSDIDKVKMSKAKNYDFSKKIRFLYIVGPHFEIEHKNFSDFVQAMFLLSKTNINFELCITLSKEQLSTSKFWNPILFKYTHYLGYITKEKISDEFRDNTILISTSIIETIGLHVVEAIQGGVIPLVPNTDSSHAVYSNLTPQYTLFDPKSMVEAILNLMAKNNEECTKLVHRLQEFLVINESKKIQTITDVFEKIIKSENV